MSVRFLLFFGASPWTKCAAHSAINHHQGHRNNTSNHHRISEWFSIGITQSFTIWISDEIATLPQTKLRLSGCHISLDSITVKTPGGCPTFWRNRDHCFPGNYDSTNIYADKAVQCWYDDTSEHGNWYMELEFAQRIVELWLPRDDTRVAALPWGSPLSPLYEDNFEFTFNLTTYREHNDLDAVQERLKSMDMGSLPGA